MCAHIPVCACVCATNFSVLLTPSTLLFLEQGLPLTWNSPSGQDWQVSELQGPTCLHLARSGIICLHLARSGIISMVHHHTWLFTWALEVEFRSLCLCAMDLSKLLSSYYTFNCYLIHTPIYFIVGWRNGSEVKLLQRTHAWLLAPMLYNIQLSLTPKGSNASAAICNSYVCTHA